jgi:hypothetical protein
MGPGPNEKNLYKIHIYQIYLFLVMKMIFIIKVFKGQKFLTIRATDKGYTVATFIFDAIRQMNFPKTKLGGMVLILLMNRSALSLIAVVF